MGQPHKQEVAASCSRVKTSALSGLALDWAVAKCEGYELNGPYKCFDGAWCIREQDGSDGDVCPEYSTDWAQGGPIIERELIDLNYDIHWIRDLLDPDDNGDRWYASKAGQDEQGCYGPTPLVAAMRCYVASKLGDEVELPEELV